MGKVLSLFRKEPSSEERLTKLEEQIKELEGYTVSTRETQRKFAGRFLVASIGTFVIAFVIVYFYFFPPTWRERLIYFLPLLLFPVVIILLKYCVSWYFNSKIDRNNRRLIKLRHEKRQVLQNVMDKETYKVALEILSTFGDRSMKLKAGYDLDSSMALNASQMNSSVSAGNQLVQRTPIRPNSNTNTQSNRFGRMATPSAPVAPLNSSMRGTPAPVGFRPAFQPPSTPHMMGRSVSTPGAVPPLNFNSQKTPFPVIDTRKQNVMEKMMDFIISDGPSNRFAMICSGCCGHNGMALQEDFEYVAFKCAFCGHLNPARKIRPKARGLSPERQQRQQSQLQVKSKAEDMSSSSEDDDEVAGVKNSPVIQTRGAREVDLEPTSESEGKEREEGKEEEEKLINATTTSETPAAATTNDSEPKDLHEKKED